MADSSPKASSGTYPAGPDVETPVARERRRLEADEALSRHVYAPRMIHGADEFVWHEIFEFPEAAGRVESAVLRRVIPDDADVHAMGCAKQAEDRAKGKQSTAYRGFISSQVGRVEAATTTRGHCVSVIHEPDEGEWHAHLKVVLAGGIEKLSKNDKSDIRALMAGSFGPLQEHACP